MSQTVYFGSTLPMQRGPRGYFQTTNDALANEKSKFINLILTKKGERVSNPNFGCDLWRLLFEQKDEEIQDKAQQYVADAVNAFMPYLVLQEIVIVNLDTFVRDANINLYVRYSFINNPLVQESIQLLLGTSPAGGLQISGRTVTRNL